MRSLHIGLALRMAGRALRRAPGNSALAVSILALGLAAPATFFSLLVGAIRPLPVPEGNRIVRMEVIQPSGGGQAGVVRLADLELLRGGSGLQGLGAFRPFGGTMVDPDRAAARFAGASLTADVLPLLRVSPVTGRIPGPGEERTTVILGYSLWQETYGGDPGALGRVVELNGESRTIVGIMPEGFGFPFNQNTWVVLPVDAGDPEPVELVGRLADEANLEGVGAELAGRWSRGDPLRAEAERGALLSVEPYTGSRGEGGEAVAFIGLVLVAIALLLIACANVANLLLVRATERVRALGIQAALGAGRGQVGAQLLLEAMLLALMGGVLGLVLADAAVDAIQQGLAAEHFGYFWMRMAVDGRVVAFMAALVAGTALTAGTLPVLRVWGVDVQQVLKQEGSAGGMGKSGAWSRVFITAQLGLSCAALVAAGLSARSLSVSRGFGGDLLPREVIVASVDPSESTADHDQTVAMLDARLAAIPEVSASAVAIGAPGYFEPYSRFALDGVTYERDEDRPGTSYNAVTPGYFALFGIEVRAGRRLASSDRRESLPVAVVSESFAREFSPDRELVGRTVSLASDSDPPRWFTIVGVVTDVDVGGGDRVRKARVYLPLAQVEVEGVGLLARTRGDVTVLAGALREAVARVDSSIPLWGVRTLHDAHAYMTRVPRAMGGMALGGGASGLLVAAVGLYGLLAFRVRQRRRELGICLALGANGRRLAGQTLVFALSQVIPALIVGLLVAWLIAPLLGAVLIGLDPRGLGTYAGVAAAFLGVTLLASAIPSLRAARVDPAEVLRGN
jgi:predicted permease